MPVYLARSYIAVHGLVEGLAARCALRNLPGACFVALNNHSLADAGKTVCRKGNVSTPTRQQDENGDRSTLHCWAVLEGQATRNSHAELVVWAQLGSTMTLI